ncbi:MAG: MerR family transcriptional regulator [Proteobacteria bacterium]|nr:MerR family transcriptional regulator [Pseudomonadota bacterium]MBU1546120.1 MerR family transcriptional regulator [Pseudomonadota bacterium]MBU2619293.1 MerR family transcriptional regulator [Pseudomonadota bacterium]
MRCQAHPSIYRISAAADMLDLHPRTLRNYEKAGLVTPSRKGKWRYYSADDIAWIRCLFSMIHGGGITIASIGKLLHYAPCWEVAECAKEKRGQCPRYLRRSREAR